jgi:hypothetical protein
MLDEYRVPDFIPTIPCPSGCVPEPPDIRIVGPHIGAYCGACDRWLKWLPKTAELKAWLAQ